MSTLAFFARTRAAYSFTLLLAIVLAAAIAGCGSLGNDVASKSPAQILAAARAAAEGASSVHIESKLAQARIASTIDVDAASSHGARGKISFGPIAYEMILVGDTAYFKGSTALYSQLVGSAAAARLPKGAWLKGSATTGQLGALASSVEQDKLLARLLESSGDLAKGANTTVNGQKVVEIKEAGHVLFTASLYIATTGKPYPIEIAKRGREHGQITFSRWGEPVSLAAPANAVDISRLQRGGH